ARGYRRSELSDGGAAHGDGRVSWRFLAGISRPADASAGAAGHRGVADGAVQRGRAGPDGTDARATRFRKLLFRARAEACDGTILPAGRGGAIWNGAGAGDFV